MPPTRTHQMLDRRSYLLHQLIAEKLIADPALLDRARATITRWRTTASVNSRPYLDAWDEILASGLDRCLAVLRDPGEEAVALRQASPFSGILPVRERAEFFKHWSER